MEEGTDTCPESATDSMLSRNVLGVCGDKQVFFVVSPSAAKPAVVVDTVDLFCMRLFGFSGLLDSWLSMYRHVF